MPSSDVAGCSRRSCRGPPPATSPSTRVWATTPHADAFAYQAEPALEVEALWQLQSSEGYPQSCEHEDEYAQGNVRVVIWRVVKRLVEAGTCAQLTVVATFRVGYQTDDDELVMLRILTWPIPQA